MPASPSDLILVFCAAGKQCRPLVSLLAKAFTNLRLVVNSEASQKNLQSQYPNAEVVCADQGDPNAVRELFRDVIAAYYVGPSMHHHETLNGYHAIDAALAEQKEGGFKHFVFSSVLKPQLRKPLNHDGKRYIEEYLFESTLDYTVLQPCNFLAENLFPIAAWSHQDQPVLCLPYDYNIPNSHILLEDLAEATVKVLQEREKHFHSEYPLCSTFPIPYKDLVPPVEKLLGKQIKIVKAPYEETVKRLVTTQFGEKYNAGNLDVAERLVLWYERYGLNGSPNVLEWLLGRKPMTIEEWIEQRVRAAKE